MRSILHIRPTSCTSTARPKLSVDVQNDFFTIVLAYFSARERFQLRITTPSLSSVMKPSTTHSASTPPSASRTSFSSQGSPRTRVVISELFALACFQVQRTLIVCSSLQKHQILEVVAGCLVNTNQVGQYHLRFVLCLSIHQFFVPARLRQFFSQA
jgi:hypothetical protein